MTFDLVDVVAVLNPGTVAAAVAVGLFFGALFFRDRRSQATYLFRSGFLGVVFLVTMLAVRYAEGFEAWERWAGTLALWGCYGIGTITGAAIARRLRRPPPGE